MQAAWSPQSCHDRTPGLDLLSSEGIPRVSAVPKGRPCMPADAGQGRTCHNASWRGSCLSLLLGKTTSQLLRVRSWAGAPLSAARSLCCIPTSIRASSGAADDFSFVAHTPGRKRKAALGIADPGEWDPRRHVGEATEVAVLHPVTMEAAVSFLEPGNVTYFRGTRMLLQPWDGKGR